MILKQDKHVSLAQLDSELMEETKLHVMLTRLTAKLSQKHLALPVFQDSGRTQELVKLAQTLTV